MSFLSKIGLFPFMKLYKQYFVNNYDERKMMFEKIADLYDPRYGNDTSTSERIIYFRFLIRSSPTLYQATGLYFQSDSDSEHVFLL